MTRLSLIHIFLREDAEDAESRLQKEIFFEFLDNLHGMCHLAEYMGLEVVKEGVLGLDSQGEMTLDGDILPLMTEVEVKLYDKEEEQEDVYKRQEGVFIFQGIYLFEAVDPIKGAVFIIVHTHQAVVSAQI